MIATCANADAAIIPPPRLANDPKQLENIAPLTAVNAVHKFYTLNYTADYKLDEALQANATDLDSLAKWVSSKLLDNGETGSVAMGEGCSALATVNDGGQIVYGRNYDYVQNAQNALVYCKPENDYASVSIAAGGWLYDTQLDGADTDRSMLVALPYLPMDGMNEKGLIVSVLKLDGAGTAQKADGKNTVVTTVAMRLALDRAATVEEALNPFAAHNHCSYMPTANFHFYLADAKDDYCILEYAPGDGGMKARGRFDAARIESDAFRANCDGADTDGDYRMVTNFYALYPASEYGFDDGQHGLDRYSILQQKLKAAAYTLNEDDAMTLLSDVYQDYGATPTHETQWSVVYNPVALTATSCPRVNQSDDKAAFYQTMYRFSLRDVFAGTGELNWETLTLSGD